MGFFGNLADLPSSLWGQARGAGGIRNAGTAIKSGLRDISTRPGEEEQRQGLTNQAGAAGAFAGRGEAGFDQVGGELNQSADWLRKVASGQESVSREQLRQSAEQNVAAQRSMALGAAPRDAAMAMFGASRNAGEIGSGLAGQQAIAGLQERQQAQRALADLLLQRRQQEMQVALQSRQNGMVGLQGITPGKSWLENWGGAIQGGMSLAGIG